MKVFITGGTGFIGSCTVQRLLAHNHEVTGLVRSDESFKKLEAAGGHPVKGDLTDLDFIVSHAKEADAFIHLGFIHDFTNYAKAIQVDTDVVEAVCNAYINTNKIFIYTAGTLGDVENDYLRSSDFYKRVLNEQTVLSYASKGVRSMVLRLPPTVHDKGDKGFVPMISGMAKQIGTMFYAEEGENVWPAVNRADAADLYILALEHPMPGTTFTAVQELVKTKDIAKTIAEKHDLEAVSVSTAELGEKFGPIFGLLFSLDNPASSEETKSITGWNPSHLKLLEDYKQNY